MATQQAEAVFLPAVEECIDKCIRCKERKTNVRILIVEDNPLDAMLLSRLIEEQGGSVTVVGTAAGLKSANMEDFDFALLDLSLPDSDPEQTLELMEQMPIPRAVITGNRCKGMCRAAGRMFVPVLIKPIGNFDLEAIAENVIGMAEAYEEQKRELKELRSILGRQNNEC